MSKQAEQQIRKRILSTSYRSHVQKLCLDNIPIIKFTPTIRKLIEGCNNLKYLTLNHCSIQSLQNFPHIASLVSLQLEGNMITDEELPKLNNVPQLGCLGLANNKIRSIHTLNHLKSLQSLQMLDIGGNLACDEDNFRRIVFQMLPNIQLLNSLDSEGNLPEQDSGSQYISSLGSRRDLLEQCEQQHINQPYIQLKQKGQKTATQYQDQKLQDSKDTIQPSRPKTNLFELFRQNSQTFPCVPQMKKQVTNCSKGEEIFDFTKKYLKIQ